MRTLGLYSVNVGVAAALLSGCGGSQSPIGAPSAMSPVSVLASPSSSTNYRVVYSFGAPPDGNSPIAALIDDGGTLYGTTSSGGVYDCTVGTGYYFGCGTVFSVTTGGREKVLNAFTAGDGAHPHSGLIDVKGTLYGTTFLGSCCEDGNVYSMTTAGSVTVLHNFKRVLRKYGANPAAELIDVHGLLYGTTYNGGLPVKEPGSTGTVFSITTAGAFSTVYRFNGGSDGSHPSGRLLDVDGTLYGATADGGSGCSSHYPYSGSCGTVYSLTTKGVEKVLYRFKGAADGVHPQGGLIDVNGIFYGATAWGGGHRNCVTESNRFYGCGTIYSITTGGKEKVLYAFTGRADGAQPNGDLIDVNGTLYGTAGGGGASNDGTLFSVTLGGSLTVLHTFSDSPDGAEPGAGLIDVRNTLYGTTGSGGSASCGTSAYPFGCGTVFALTP
ncbi:MAG: choice-of-anchor tandem repeat GloVer-containing protein [Candidatus Cybelea sp.]|jgi:uncharacterized repeat protein (TIGR03803 family)